MAYGAIYGESLSYKTYCKERFDLRWGICQFTGNYGSWQCILV